MMKKFTALLALFLLLALFAQSACAATVSSLSFYRGNNTHLQDENLLCGKVYPTDTPFSKYENFQISLSSPYPEQQPLRDSLCDSFSQYFEKECDLPAPAPGYVRRIMLMDMSLLANRTNNDGPVELMPLRADAGDAKSIPVYPYVPLTEFVPAGARFENLRVFHGLENDPKNPTAWDWDLQENVLFNGLPKLVQDGEDSYSFSSNNMLPSGLTTSNPDYTLQISINYGFSPFAIVWDELPAASDLPETGDASPLAPWLLLLCGACALLIFAKKKSAASA